MYTKKKYDWAAVNEYYQQGHTYKECRAYFGFSARSWDLAVKRGDIQVRPKSKMDLDKIITGEISYASRTHLRNRYIAEGLLRYKCAICGISEWQGKPISLHLDHINGINDDDRLENVRLICPNCHSQTDSYAGKNVGSGKYNRSQRKK